ncbi:UNVERIFIED_ORG: hypothetical protein ABID33_000272 [Xanthobacter viscosus]|uniref:SGNH/GDSL hydrolase family protein n=1 Tax=Xanthobacter autotrophicus TaxID=280 RepID=A0A6C1KHS9_XANAU|nr:SGNH/GDSL hydrolase family protein [Xanthobacter autotrophicus]TLX43839.1 SGNH/GDSL hydrolase family protein [Xanthobacter autotrophicus]
MSIDSIARGLAAAPWTRQRSPNLVATLGDSIAAALYLDSQYNNTGARSQLAWAQRLVVNGYSNRFKLTAASRGLFGYAGYRTDQVISAYLSPCIASGAGTVILIVGTNNAAQIWPDAGTCVSRAVSDIKYMANAIVAAGAQVIIELLPGATNLNATTSGYINGINNALIEWAPTAPKGVYLHDASKVVLDPINSTTVFAPKANYFYDTTHPAPLGGFYWGLSLRTLMDTIIPPYPRLGHLNSNTQPTLYLPNGFFVTQTGGTNSIGAALTSGAVPANWQLNRSGSPTVAITYGTDNATTLDPAVGSKCILTATFTAAGERIYLVTSATVQNLAIGDIFDFGIRANVVSGMSSLASVRARVDTTIDSVTTNIYSLIEGSTAEYGPDIAYTVDHVVGPVSLAGTTLSSVYPRIELVARAAGTVVVEVSRGVIRKRSTM